MDVPVDMPVDVLGASGVLGTSGRGKPAELPFRYLPACRTSVLVVQN